MHWDLQKIQPLKKKSLFFNAANQANIGVFNRGLSLIQKPVQQVLAEQPVEQPAKQIVSGKRRLPNLARPLKNYLIKSNTTQVQQHAAIEDNNTAEAATVDDELAQTELLDDLTLLMFVTHVWTSNIKKYFLKLKENCDAYFIDIVIMVCIEKPSSEDLVGKIQGDLNFDIQIFNPTLKEIQSLYAKNTFNQKGLWASNHWLLMWLWKFYAKDLGYEKVWSFEYDIRFNGSLKPIFSIDSSFDYVQSKTMTSRAGQTMSFWGPIVTKWNPNWTGMKQFFRLSRTFLNYLHEQFLLGYNSQDEMTLASHAREPLNFKNGFKYTACTEFLCSTWGPGINSRTTSDWASYEKLINPKLKLFHPIKD